MDFELQRDHSENGRETCSLWLDTTFAEDDRP